MKDLSLKTLRVFYECQDSGNINEYFDKEMGELAEKYGLRFWASGVGLESGVRDLAFDTKNKVNHGTGGGVGTAPVRGRG